MLRTGSCLCSLALLGVLALGAGAHPVPRRAHDRTILVRLVPEAGSLLVAVDYRLEVDEFTVVFDDLPALGEKVELTKLRKPAEIYDAFMRAYAPILAANLIASLDGQALEFTCARRSHQLKDENGTALGHLRCDFLFEARKSLGGEGEEVKQSDGTGQTSRQHTFRFRESNYELEEGAIRLSLEARDGLALLSSDVPDAALQSRPPAQLRPGDDARLRTLSATFVRSSGVKDGSGTTAGRGDLTSGEPEAAPLRPTESAPAGVAEEQAPEGLLALLLDSKHGLAVLLFLAACFGAVHALTPGHGKTLVAAYLVGERGTVGHALLLGLVTTLTHTGVVLAVAAVLQVFFPQASPRDVQFVLGLGGGLLVAGLGLWLLLRRLSGAADHVHFGGSGHHHHGLLGHSHGKHGHAHALPTAAAGVSGWGLIVLGIGGGIVPCWDAIILLGLAILTQRVWLGLPLVLAFSAGLAATLVAIGVAVVYAKGFASSHWGESRLFRFLPIISAALVTCMGLWLCYTTVHAPVSPPAQARPAR